MTATPMPDPIQHADAAHDGDVRVGQPHVDRIAVRHASRDVLGAARDAISRGDAATLAIVLHTEGSTYVAPGAMALFGGADGQAGWLSGGCLEPEIARVAQRAADDGRIAWMAVDTRDDEDLMSGSALGCRGLLRIALLPLGALDGADRALSTWLDGRVALTLSIARGGDVALVVGDGSSVSADVADAPHVDARSDASPHLADAAGLDARAWRVPADPVDWPTPAQAWQVTLAPPPEVVVFGAGPETPTLLPLLRAMGWRTTLVERRARWIDHARLADRHVDGAPAGALRTVSEPDTRAAVAPRFDAALVMHHNFELDREALDLLAADATAFVGLLGPVRRREDLFKVLPASHRDALQPRLRSPIGMKLGGHGPEAIALSIAAQLQAWRHGEACA